MTGRISLRTHLLLLVGAPLLALLLIEMVFSYRVGTNTANEVFDSWLLDSAHSIAQEIRFEDEQPRFIAAADAVEMFEWDEVDETYFHIADAAGNKIAGDLPAPPPVDRVALRRAPVFGEIDIDGVPGRVVSVLRNPGEPNEVVVQVAETLNKRRSTTAEVLALVLLKEVLLVAGVIVAVAFAVSRGLAPIRRLSGELARRSPRDFTPMASGAAPQEVQALVENTNSLLERIEHTLSAHERFIGNIAHQVRTPLAGIKLQTQLALRETDRDKVRRALEKIGDAADHMTHMNSQLLRLARAQIALDRGMPAGPVDLAGIAAACCRELEPLARSHGVTLEIADHTDRREVAGDPTLLHEMLRNLVENAIVYSREEGRVCIRIDAKPDTLRLIVEDDGPGIDDRYREQVFEQFFRPPGTPGDGSGLGLHIVREIARAHGGDVTLESREAAGGSRFVVDLPTTESARSALGRSAA